MPESTPIFAIPYPCSGEQIDCTVFEAFTEAIQDAIDDVRVQEAAALNRPAAKVTGTTAGVAVNVATNMTYSTEEFDVGGLANLGVNNDRLTVVSAGIYLVEARVISAGVITTLTSQALSLSQNGTNRYRVKETNRNNSQAIWLHAIGLMGCAAGDVIRANYLWTGTGGPDSITTLLSARLVALT